MAARLIGLHIVTDNKICHGLPTFRGIRILVSDVLEQVAEGMAWETIVEEWHGSIGKEAITEALKLAGKALLDHLDEYVVGEPSRSLPFSIHSPG